ncbi:hypothetical protein LTR08_005922 [Meristemomyces frigidus]|nr:hypothetical protein LTR08_005922 [Meristemomyces frigidus]
MALRRLQFDLTSRIVRIKCGQSDIIYHVHSDLLRQTSKELADGMDALFEDKMDNLLSFDVPCQGFGAFVKWLYGCEVEWRTRKTSWEQDFGLLQAAYAAGSALGVDLQFQHKVLDELMITFGEFDSGEGWYSNEELLLALVETFGREPRGRQILMDSLFGAYDLLRPETYGEESRDFCLAMANEFISQIPAGDKDNEERPSKRQCA